MNMRQILFSVIFISFLKISVKGHEVIEFDKSSHIDQFSSDCDRQRDSLALVALYQSTEGENWLNTWDLSTPISEWYGIVLSDEGCVEEIELDGEIGTAGISFGSGGNNLIGELPNEIGDLKSLRRLLLCCNRLSGGIPSTITGLPELRDLYLSDNQLIGQLPQTIGKLKNLEALIVSDNLITGVIPTSIGGLTSLVTLQLNGNQIGGAIPSTIGNLRNLKSILLQDNQLTGEIPNSIGLLTRLRTLVLSNNQLTGRIPPSIGQNSPLFNNLDLGNNNLSGPIPSDFGNLQNLLLLDISNNDLSGPIPPELGLLDDLFTLLLNDNNLRSCIPAELLQFCDVMEVSFSNNPLLPWMGDFNRFCLRESQVTAFCDDGDPLTVSDKLDENCDCGAYVEEVILFSSKAVSACGVDELVLSAEILGDSYLWSTGNTSQFLPVSSAGLYWLDLSIDGSIYRDSIEVTFVTDELGLGEDLTLCYGEDATLLMSNIQADYYLWSTGSTDLSIQVEKSSEYWLETTVGECVFKDTIGVTLKGEELDIGDIAYVCHEQATVTIMSNLDADSYLWNTGETSKAIDVSTIGEYWLETIIEDCVDRDTIFLQDVSSGVTITQALENCISQVYSLSSDVDAEKFLWSTGEITKEIEVERTGQYWLEVQRGACINRDSINILIGDKLGLLIPTDTTICMGELLFSEWINTGIDIQWLDGYPNINRPFTESGSFDYVLDSGQCTNSSSIRVDVIPCSEEDCPIYIPNVISANSELVENRRFSIFSECVLQSFSVEIYDRWGSQVYKTSDQNGSWDGLFINENLVKGVYIVQVSYKLRSEQNQIKIQQTLSVI